MDLMTLSDLRLFNELTSHNEFVEFVLLTKLISNNSRDPNYFHVALLGNELTFLLMLHLLCNEVLFPVFFHINFILYGLQFNFLHLQFSLFLQFCLLPLSYLEAYFHFLFGSYNLLIRHSIDFLPTSYIRFLSYVLYSKCHVLFVATIMYINYFSISHVPRS